MSETVVWLIAFVGAYWAYCLYWGIVSARMAGTAAGYFLADRRLPHWVFVLAATATSFSGWMFLGHPGFVFRDGFQFAQLALCAITIPLTGVVFLKRQWLLGRRHGYVTAGDMFADYFRSHAMRLMVVLIALVFSIPFLGLQLRASGYLVESLSGGTIDRNLAMWALTSVVFLYVVFGGLRAVAYVGTLQSLLLASGIVAIGLVAFGKLGGFGAFNADMAKLGATAAAPFGATAQGYNAYFEIPGVIQFTAGLGQESPVGGIWTAAMILSYSFALMGIQAAPAFSMWAFGSRDIKGFAPQQVWVSAAAAGIILVFFGAAEGMGAHFLGAAPGSESGWLAATDPSRATTLVDSYIAAIAKSAPWFGGLLALCALAAIQAITAFYASTAGTMLARDIYKCYLRPAADDREQKLYGRIGVGLVILIALLLATFAPATQNELGSLALGFGFQLWPALAAICWLPWITREGAAVGLAAGMIAVIFTEPFGASVAQFAGFHLPWGRWPWTIHSAGWGIFVNLVLCAIVSALTQTGEERARRRGYHAFLSEHAAVPPGRGALRPVAWAITLIWLFFALGPGALLGNDLFGAPNGGIAAWHLGLPSLWAWQILWWALGVLVIWFLAYRMDMSTAPRRTLEFGAPDYVAAAMPIGLVWQRAFWTLMSGFAAIALLHWMFG